MCVRERTHPGASTGINSNDGRQNWQRRKAEKVSTHI